MTKTNSHENDRPSPCGQKSTAKRRANDASKSSSLSLDGAENKRELAETFCESGADALLGGDVDDALDSYLRAVKLDPNSSVARAGLARAFLADERYKRAFEEADRAIKLDASNSQAYELRGHASRLLEKYEDAIRDYDRALELDRRAYLAFYGRAVARGAPARGRAAQRAALRGGRAL